jgi:RHS repeat-associated protein
LRWSAHQGGAANAYTFIWDGQDLLNEYVSGGLSTRYAVLDGEVLARKQGASRYVFVPDPLGSVHHLLDSSLNKAATMVYWPYGELQSLTGVGLPVQFVGGLGYYTAAQNRVYVRARWYRPDLGRWQTVDPIGFDAGDWNVYRYAGGRPVGAADPGGLGPTLPGHPRHPCATHPGGPCQYVKEHEPWMFGGALGFVLCCEGKPYPCGQLPPGAPPELLVCIKAHERHHIPDTDCTCRYATPPLSRQFCYGIWRDPARRSASECEAWRLSFYCLVTEMLRKCGSLSPSARSVCEDPFLEFIALSCDCALYNCAVEFGTVFEPVLCEEYRHRAGRTFIADCSAWYA